MSLVSPSIYDLNVSKIPSIKTQRKHSDKKEKKWKLIETTFKKKMPKIYITQEMGMGEFNSHIHRTTTSTAISTKDLRS